MTVKRNQTVWRRLHGVSAFITIMIVTAFVLFKSPKKLTDEVSLKDREEQDLNFKSGNIERSKISDIFSAEEKWLYSNGWTDEKNDRFLDYIRRRWLVAPSHGVVNATLFTTEDHSQFGQSKYVDKLLQQKTHGFFVESGASDGKTYSNSLFFELQRSWTGLLIEPNAKFFHQIMSRNRNASAINSCLSTRNSTQRVTFKPFGVVGGVVGKMDAPHLKWLKRAPNYNSINDTTAQCFTLYSLLLALGQTKVDYFSLDVEGPELEILQTIPFDKLTVDVISVEYRVVGDVDAVNDLATMEKLKNIRNLFKSIGNYAEIAILPWGTHINKNKQDIKGLDVIFKRIH